MITYTEGTAKQIYNIIEMMEGSLIGQNRQHVMMACLSLAIAIQNPDISLPRLISGVKSTSEHITLLVEEENPTSQMRVN